MKGKGEMKKKFSICIPVYKNEKNLPITIPYIIQHLDLFQEFDVEIVMVNDGSPDNSYQVMQEFQKQYPDIIRIATLTRNFGQGACTHCCLSMEMCIRDSIGLEYSGGTLGMALSVGVGMALDAKIKKRSNKVYVMIGDGECNEGIIWEAIMTAAKYQLSNLVIIVDRNKLQLSGTTEEVMDMGDLGRKFAEFGCSVQDVNGHDIEELLKAYTNLSDTAPNVIIAHTVKGKGLSFVENHVEWHQNVLSDEQYEQALQELGGKS